MISRIPSPTPTLTPRHRIPHLFIHFRLFLISSLPSTLFSAVYYIFPLPHFLLLLSFLFPLIPFVLFLIFSFPSTPFSAVSYYLFSSLYTFFYWVHRPLFSFLPQLSLFLPFSTHISPTLFYPVLPHALS